MKARKVVVLSLALAVTASIAAASVAQAEPEFYSKAAVGSAVGNVEFGTGSGTVFLEGHTSKEKLQCTGSTGRGETTGPTSTAKNVILLTTCEFAGAAIPCENVGAKEIETKPLVGELGAITATSPGIRLRPESGSYLAEFNCAGGAVALKWVGSLLGSVTGDSGETVEEGALPASLKLTNAQTGGIEKYTHFLTGPSEQITQLVSEFSTEKGEYVTHEELYGISMVQTIDTTPAANLGITK
jgi:hypothetical protein